MSITTILLLVINFIKKTFGVAMGSPLSPVLADIYMEYFESVLLTSTGMVPLLWLRYVGDVFCLWDGRVDFQFFPRQYQFSCH